MKFINQMGKEHATNTDKTYTVIGGIDCKECVHQYVSSTPDPCDDCIHNGGHSNSFDQL